MIRGSAFSAILHGLLLAGLIFGLPSLIRFVEESEPIEPTHIQVAAITPEESAAIDKAAAHPLPDIDSPTGGKSGLSTDAINTETPEDRRTILQSRAASSTQTSPAESKIDEKTPTPNQPPTPPPPTDAVAERPPTDPTPPAPTPPSEPQPQDARIEPPVVQPPPTPVRDVVPPPPQPPDPVRPIPPEPIPPVPQVAQPTPLLPTPLLPPQPATPQPPPLQAAAPAQPSIAFLPSQASQPASAPSATATANAPAEPPPSAAPPPPSASAILANADAVAKTLLPLADALPRLDSTIGEILVAQSRDAAAARLAAQGTPALQQSIGRMATAAEQGYAHAQFSLAEIYLTGDGQPRDVARGKQYLMRASMNGYLPAQLLTAAIAIEGSVAERDIAEAHAWLSIAAEKGSKAAAETLKELEKQMTVRDDLRARQRRNQLRQVFVLSQPKVLDPAKKQPLEEDLRIATTLGDEEAVYVLLAQGSDANKPDEDGRTAAIEAAWRGYGKIIDALIEQGADAKVTDGSGKTALIWAAINGHAAISERLIKAEVPVNARDQEGLTALMRAAWNGHADVVRVLLQRKADPTLRDRSGKTALDYANQARNPETIRLMQAASRN